MTKYIVKTCAYNTQLRATVHKYSGESHLLFFLKLMRIKGNVHLLLLTNYDVKKNAFIDDISGDTSILFYRYYDKLFVSDNKLFSQELETRYTGEKKIIDLALLYLLDEVKENDQRIVPLLEANKSLYAGSEDKVRLHLVLAKYYTKSGELGNATEQLATAAEYLNKIKNTELEAEYKADVEIVKIMNLIRLTEPNPEAWKTTSASTPVSACEKECERMLKSGELKAGVTLQDCMKIVCK